MLLGPNLIGGGGAGCGAWKRVGGSVWGSLLIGAAIIMSVMPVALGLRGGFLRFIPESDELLLLDMTSNKFLCYGPDAYVELTTGANCPQNQSTNPARECALVAGCLGYSGSNLCFKGETRQTILYRTGVCPPQVRFVYLFPGIIESYTGSGTILCDSQYRYTNENGIFITCNSYVDMPVVPKEIILYNTIKGKSIGVIDVLFSPVLDQSGQGYRSIPFKVFVSLLALLILSGGIYRAYRSRLHRWIGREWARLRI